MAAVPSAGGAAASEALAAAAWAAWALLVAALRRFGDSLKEVMHPLHAQGCWANAARWPSAGEHDTCEHIVVQVGAGVPSHWQ